MAKRVRPLETRKAELEQKLARIELHMKIRELRAKMPARIRRARK